MGSAEDGETIIALSPMDNVMARVYAKTLACFSLGPSATVEEAYDLLRRSLCMTVSEMPIYGGKVHRRPKGRPGWKPGQLEVRIPKNPGQDGRFPLDFSDVSAEIDYDDLLNDGFPAEKLNGDVFLKRVFEADLMNGLDTGMDAIIMQATFCGSGFILGLGTWHSLTDGYGVWNLSERWSFWCKRLQQEPILFTVNYITPISADVIEENNDRSVLTKIWRKETSEVPRRSAAEEKRLWNFLGLHPPSANKGPAGQIAKYKKYMTLTGGLILALSIVPLRMWTGYARAITALALGGLGATLASSRTQDAAIRAMVSRVGVGALAGNSTDSTARVMRTCMFYMSKSRFAKLKTDAASTAKHISSVDALHGLIWRVVMKARFPDTRPDDATEAEMLNLVDGRLQFSPQLPDSYLGNMVFFARAALPLGVVTGPNTTVGDMAVAVRNTLDSYTSSDMHGAFGLAENLSQYNELSYTFAALEGPTMNITDNLHMPLPSISFGPAFGSSGGGNPDSIRVARDEMDAYFRRVVVLPMTKSGGVEVLIALYNDEMDRLLADKEFAKYAQFTSY